MDLSLSLFFFFSKDYYFGWVVIEASCGKRDAARSEESHRGRGRESAGERAGSDEARDDDEKE